MKSSLHLVLPKKMMSYAIQEFSNIESYEITDSDYNFDEFYHYATADKGVTADHVLIVERFDKDIPLEVKINDFIKKLTEIKIKNPNTRLIIVLPEDYSINIVFKKRLVSLGVYDFHFAERFVFDNLLDWLNTPRTLTDVQDIITDSEEYVTVNKQPVKQEKIKEKSSFEKKNTLTSDHEIELIEQTSVENNNSKPIFHTRYQPIPSRLIIIGSLYRGAGSTLLATNMARMIAKRDIDVAYIEHPLTAGYMYDFLQIHQSEEPYAELAYEISQNGLSKANGHSFFKYGINWYVNDSRKEPLKHFSYENHLYLTHSIKSSITILDVSDRWLDTEVQKILHLADEIVLCVDPDPVKFDRSLFEIPGYQPKEKKIMQLLNDEHEEHFNIAMMKLFKGVDRKLLKEMLPFNAGIEMPYIPYEEIQTSLYKSKLIYDTGYADEFERHLLPFVEAILPNGFGKSRNKPTFISKLISKTKK